MKKRMCRICQVWFVPESPAQHCCGDCDETDEPISRWLDEDLTSTRAREPERKEDKP